MAKDIYDYCGSCDKNGEDDKHCKLCLRQTLSTFRDCLKPQHYIKHKRTGGYIMNNQQIISKFGEINNISHKVINDLSVDNITDNEVLEQTELIENKLIEIRLAIVKE